MFIFPISHYSSSSFLPDSISGLKIWLDADDASTITEVANKVSLWSDKSGSNNDFPQATGAKQPSTNTRTQNGKNVIDFDGSDKSIRNAVSSLSNSGGMDIFIVAKQDVVSGTFLGNTFLRSGLELGIYTEALMFSFHSRTAGGSFKSVKAAEDLSPHVFTGIFPLNTGDFITARIDESQIGTTGGADMLYTNPALTIGVSDGFSQFDLDGYIAEVLIYNRNLSAPEITSVESYLNSKWGL